MAIITVRPIQHNIEEILKCEDQFGLSTGILGIDEAINGLRPANLIMIGAYVGAGKTSLATDMILATAKEVPSAMFSLEMSVNQIVDRAIYNKAQINYHSGKAGRLDKSDEADLKEATNYIKGLKDIYIDEVARTMYPSWILAKEEKEDSIEQAFKRYYDAGCRAFYFDYVQLIGYGFKSESETLRLKAITGKLHQMAVEYQVPIICLAQLKKGDEESNKQEPSISSIRDSGYLLADSDIILLLHRPSYFTPKEEIDMFSQHSEDAYVICCKNRNGPLGKIPVKFQGWNMSWKGLESGGI